MNWPEGTKIEVVTPDSVVPVEFITIEEAKRRGLEVPERAGSVINVFNYVPAEKAII